MAVIEKIKKAAQRPVARRAILQDLRDKIQLTVWGSKNERVRIRLVDSSQQVIRFFDGEHYVSELNFRIPKDSLDVEFAKPGLDKCTFEIATRDKTEFLDYRAA